MDTLPIYGSLAASLNVKPVLQNGSVSRVDNNYYPSREQLSEKEIPRDVQNKIISEKQNNTSDNPASNLRFRTNVPVSDIHKVQIPFVDPDKNLVKDNKFYADNQLDLFTVEEIKKDNQPKIGSGFYFIPNNTKEFSTGLKLKKQV